MARRVRRRSLGALPRLVAGADCCYDRRERVCAAAAVVWDMDTGAVVEARATLAAVDFPYMPGLFAFREAPAILRALGLLSVSPQLLICDGHGVAHPRRFGLASHVGVLTGMPAVGCAKKPLCGTFAEPGRRRGSRTPLTDRGERIGTVLRTRDGVRPVYVSVGHLIDLPGAERAILACARRYRLPEPLRLAHRRAAAALRKARSLNDSTD